MRLIVFLFLLSAGSLFCQNLKWHIAFDSATCFSSPRLVDLNQDDTLDIIIGAGQEERYSPNGILAINGANGSLLWRKSAPDQIFGSALIGDVNEDQRPDILIAGRSAFFEALNGVDGSRIWAFEPDSLPPPADMALFNCYSAQWCPDLNADGWEDVLLMYGGNPARFPTDSIRDPAYLIILDRLSGQVLRAESMPDGQESYMSPYLLDLVGADSLSLLWGTGGESLPGQFFKLKWTDFLQDGLSPADSLLTGLEKGFIAVPAVADLNGDQTHDLIIPSMDGYLRALDGSSGQKIWEIHFEGAECYASPVLGQFTMDPGPDVFIQVAYGPGWPIYTHFKQYIVDGSNGVIIWSDSSTVWQLGGGVALDFDEDGWDELLVLKNYSQSVNPTQYSHQLHLLDPNDSVYMPILPGGSGMNLFSFPVLGDLDQNGKMDLIYSHALDSLSWHSRAGFVLACWEFPFEDHHPAWAGYMGTYQNGLFQSQHTSIIEDKYIKKPSWNIVPNPSGQELELRDLPVGPIEICIYDIQGKKWIMKPEDGKLDIQFLPAGIYTMEVKELETRLSPKSTRLFIKSNQK